MIKKQEFINALSTLLFSWGGDTPPEAVWAANEMLEWYEKEYGVKLNIEIEEDGSTDFEDVKRAILAN